MHATPHDKAFHSSPNESHASPGAIDDLGRIFNTAIVASRVANRAERGSDRGDSSSELIELMRSPAFRSILNSVRQLSRLQGIPERQAAEQVIDTFRRMDRLWEDYVYREGVERLRGQMPQL